MDEEAIIALQQVVAELTERIDILEDKVEELMGVHASEKE